MPMLRRTSRKPAGESFIDPARPPAPRRASGRSSRFIHRTSVDFPAPDNPMMPNISPSCTGQVDVIQCCQCPVLRVEGLIRFRSSIMKYSFLRE